MPNPQKILILSWEIFPIYAGGLGVLTLDLVTELRNQGADVTVLVPHKKVNNNDKKTISLEKQTLRYYKNGSKVPHFEFKIDHFRSSNRNPQVTIPPLFSDKKTNTQQNLYPNQTPLLTQAFAFSVLEYLLQNDDFDLVIGMDWLSIASFVLLKNEKPNTPFWFYINSTELDRTNDNKLTGTAKAIFDIEKEYIKRADRVIAISSVTKQILVGKLHVDPNKILIISNHVSFSPYISGFPELDKGKNVLFIGRLAPQKGLSFLLDTAERVLSFDRNVKFIVAGDGELLADVVENVCERKLENNVLFTGWVNMDQKKQLYRSSDLFVMSSPSEPFGLTPLEAVISGVPVISSKNCGFLDVIPSTPTYEYFDTHHFADLILYYLNNPDKAKLLIGQQKKELDNHSWSTQVIKILYEVKNHRSL